MWQLVFGHGISSLSNGFLFSSTSNGSVASAVTWSCEGGNGFAWRHNKHEFSWRTLYSNSVSQRIQPCRFHQRFTKSFYTCRSRKPEKTLMTWLSFHTFGICMCNIGEIDPRGWFHKHFTSSFCNKRSQKHKKTLIIWLSFHAFGISASKSCLMLVKSTPDRLLNILRTI